MSGAVNRENELRTLENLLTKSAASFVFINGPADSGKTTLLQRATEIEGISSLFIDALECITMTILYERILTFVSKALPGNRNIPSSTKPCSTITEMVTRLSALNWPSEHKIVIFLDEAERLFQLDSSSFSVLLRLPEMLEHKIALVMASREQFDDFGPSVTGGLVPIKISLSSFSAEETRAIISKQLATESVSRDEIEKSVKIVQQVSNSTVKELSVLRSLTASILNNVSNPEKLPKLIKERLDASNQLDSFYFQTISSLNLIEKYLLIASYIASFQTGREDSKVFGSELAAKKKTAKKFNPAKDPANCKNVDKLTVKLPKLFAQTRLIAIFYFLIQGLEVLPSPQQLQLHIKSLCDRGLLKFSGNSATKIESLKYRVNISKDFALNISKGLEIKLNNYIDN